MPLDQRPRHALERLRLLAEEARGVDDALDVLGRGAAASAAGVGYAANSAGVTWLTPASVDCADRIVAASSSNAFVNRSSVSASGCWRPSAATTAWTSAGVFT